MAFQEVQSLDADTTISLGGVNRKTGKKNPTSAEGYYLGARQINSPKSKTGKAWLYFFQTPTGNLGVYGKTDLDKKMGSAVPGQMMRITVAGMVPTPNGDMYKFKVEVDADNTIDVSNLSTEAVVTSSDDDTSYTSASIEQDAYTEETQDDEDALQAAALAAAERKAKVEALLKGKGAASKTK